MAIFSYSLLCSVRKRRMPMVPSERFPSAETGAGRGKLAIAATGPKQQTGKAQDKWGKGP
ncbi:MAG TPA: hypothetical protein VHX65_14050 [Pirellulales bacterium]|jgi:hypothetical protein|nr:hypothetical protein [Pirellulales bacterium]